MSCCSNKKMNSVEILSHLLANTYVLLVKTQNVHWNVKGESFGTVHSLTENHYNVLFDVIDIIAERIRMVKAIAPATMSEFLKISCISEELKAKDSKEMLKELLEDHKLIVRSLKKAISDLNDSDDFGTIDLITSRLTYHEKIVWMLTSSLEK